MSERAKELIRKAKERWGNVHIAYCRVCKVDTHSVLQLSINDDAAYLTCSICRLARSGFPIIRYSLPEKTPS